MLVTNNKRPSTGLQKVNDTVAPLGIYDISFSLASNSHGNFYIKIAFDWLPLHKKSLVYRNIIRKTVWLALIDLHNFFDNFSNIKNMKDKKRTEELRFFKGAEEVVTLE